MKIVVSLTRTDKYIVSHVIKKYLSKCIEKESASEKENFRPRFVNSQFKFTMRFFLTDGTDKM